jgi:hypothetical protein
MCVLSAFNVSDLGLIQNLPRDPFLALLQKELEKQSTKRLRKESLRNSEIQRILGGKKVETREWRAGIWNLREEIEEKIGTWKD